MLPSLHSPSCPWITGCGLSQPWYWGLLSEMQRLPLKSKLSNTHIRAQSWRCWRQFLGQRFVVLSNLHKLWWHPKCLNHANIINSGGHSGHQRRNRVSFLGQKVLSLRIRWMDSFTACDHCYLGQNSSTFSPPMATHTSLLLPGGPACLFINLIHSISILRKDYS